MNGVLHKVFTTRYYKLNTGFFLLLFILLFGLLNGQATIDLHHAIMQAITGSWAYCGIAMLVWTLYNIKCITFCIKELDEPKNMFLYSMQGLTNTKQYLLLLRTHATLYLPLLIYAAVTTCVGIAEHEYARTAVFLLFVTASCMAGAWVYRQKINSSWKQPLIQLPDIGLGGKKSFSFYLVHYSLHYRKWTFIGIKLLSLLLLQVMVTANSNKMSREAICVLIMFLVSAHSLLPVYYVRFVEEGMPFLRNMPISLVKRYSMFVLTYAIIFLPELLFLLLNEQHIMPVQLILSLYAVAISQLLLYTSLLYMKGMRTEQYSMWVCGIFFVTLLLLASLNLWPVFVAELVVASVLYVVLYERYEAVVG